MRKLFWGCLVGGVAVAGGMFGVAYHTCCYPDSMVGKCVLGASRVVTPISMPSLGIGTENAPGSSEASEQRQPCPEGIIAPVEDPLEPVHMEPMTGVVEPSAAPITIHEDEELTPLQVPAEINSTIDKSDLPMGDNHCPGEMPYCEDKGKDGEKSEEGEDAFQQVCPGTTGEGEECEGVSILEKLFQMLKVEMPGWWFIPAEETKPSEAPEPREDVNHHRSYPGCPYTGHGPGTISPSSAPPAPPKPEAGHEEPSEEIKTSLHKAHKLKQRLAGEELESSPEHPEIDTMEFRPSDANLYDYKLAGPL